MHVCAKQTDQEEDDDFIAVTQGLHILAASLTPQ